MHYNLYLELWLDCLVQWLNIIVHSKDILKQWHSVSLYQIPKQQLLVNSSILNKVTAALIKVYLIVNVPVKVIVNDDRWIFDS